MGAEDQTQVLWKRNMLALSPGHPAPGTLFLTFPILSLKAIALCCALLWVPYFLVGFFCFPHWTKQNRPICPDSSQYLLFPMILKLRICSYLGVWLFGMKTVLALIHLSTMQAFVLLKAHPKDELMNSHIHLIWLHGCILSDLGCEMVMEFYPYGTVRPNKPLLL